MNASGHIADGTLLAWKLRLLPAAEIPGVAKHLEECADCRNKTISSGDAARLGQALSGQGGDAPVRHLEYEDLEDLVDGRDLAQTFEKHLAVCDMCRRELDDLREFRSAEFRGVMERRRPARQTRYYTWPAAGLIAAAAVLVFAVMPRKSVVAPPGASVVVESVASVNDSGRVISLDAAGGVHGISGARADQVALVAAALKTGSIPDATREPGLLRKREVQLGGSATGSRTFSLVAPVGSVVEALSPRLQWIRPPGASGVVVAVFSTAFEAVAESSVLSADEWTVSRPLKDGETYLWSVSGIVRGERVTAPRAPEPEARFRVATAAERAEMAAARAVSPPSDLLLALVAGRLGMRDAARASLGRLAKSNADSQIVFRPR